SDRRASRGSHRRGRHACGVACARRALLHAVQDAVQRLSSGDSAMRGLESLWYGRHPARWLLWPVSWIYGVVVALRRAAYRQGLRRSIELPVPVVVLGNISVGGTGKTPTAIWLAQQLQAHGYTVGIISRGYGGRSRFWPRLVS